MQERRKKSINIFLSLQVQTFQQMQVEKAQKLTQHESLKKNYT